MAKLKSPRSPSIDLEDSIAKAEKIYRKEHRHPAPTEVIAQNIGYKSANNGAALAAIASLKYYGLLERPKDGHLVVSKEVETYLYTPDTEVKRALLVRWMTSPAVFRDLIEKYAVGLPSDATLRFDLISMGFSPQTAESVLVVFKRSADFSEVYAKKSDDISPTVHEGSSRPHEKDDSEAKENILPLETGRHSAESATARDSDLDRIPVRLPDGRKAWLIIPSPFFKSDKERLKAQIDLLLANDE